MTKTGWYSADQKPVRVGWYERWFTDGLFFHHWNGEFWSSQIDGKPHWRQFADSPYPVWRGLTQQSTHGIKGNA